CRTLHFLPTRRSSDLIYDIRQYVGMVFQHFNLFPHVTALDNCTLAPINVAKVDKKKAVETAQYYLQRVGLFDRRHHYPAQLSGGDRKSTRLNSSHVKI